MSKPVLYILFLICCFGASGQINLVPNGSFEDYTECPQGNDLNNGQFERAIGWWRPTMSTPDYFNGCNNGIVSIPNNFWGHQNAYHGNAYVGIVPIEWNTNMEYVGNEYFRTELLQALKPCVEYKFTMYVSLAEYSTHGIGKLGAWFSQDNDYTPIWGSLEKIPQVVYSGAPIIDTVNWVKVEGSFIANGFEKYLTIGYFNNTVAMDTTFIQDWGFGSAPYYYIDSISLYETIAVSSDICDAGQIIFPNVITPNDDGSNDKLDASMYFGFIKEILILNRWGNTICVLTKDSPIWDGENCTDGVYYYFFEFDTGNQKQQQTGFIQLVR